MSNRAQRRAGGRQQPQNPREALHHALQASQDQIEDLRRELTVQGMILNYVANLAGVSQQVEAIRKKADAENPAQPIPNPPSEQPFETTEEAATPEATDDVRNPGMTPGSVDNVAADATDVALAPGASLPTAPFNDLQDVQAPVAGTETQLPLDQTRIETDVRVGDPMNPQGAFPWTISPNQSNQVAASVQDPGARTFGAIRLARLRIEAGVSGGETNDLVLGEKIASSKMSDHDIEVEIKTLASVRQATATRQARPAHLVPRQAATQRTTPSLTGEGGLSTLASQASVSSDTADSDLFD